MFASHGSIAPKSPFTTIVSQFTIVVYQHYNINDERIVSLQHGMWTYDSCEV